MSDPSKSHDILYDILRVLERIEKKLNGHEERFQRLEDATKSSKSREGNDEDGQIIESWASNSPSTGQTTAVSVEKNGPETTKTMPKISYVDWDVDRFIRNLPSSVYEEWGAPSSHLERFYSLTDVSPGLIKRLGSCWEMPDDARFPLKFLKSNILKAHVIGIGPHVDTLSKARHRLERELSQLCDFDDALRTHPGNDFVVVDFDPQNNSRMYRLGQQAVGPDIYVDAADPQRAPWSRLILYQGATTGYSIDKKSKRPEIPYFSRTDRIVGVWDHLSYHLSLKNRSITANPYFSPWTGFHTTFYEIIESTEMKTKEIWKHGPLYEHPLGWNFRKCAFTLYSPASRDTLSPSTESLETTPEDSRRYWTLLVLAPNGFFNEHNIWFPSKTAEVGFKTSKVVVDPLGKLTQLGAELKFVGQGMEKIGERWSEFQAYFDYMLDSGNSLMHPTEHDNLLFDDSAFSRSRKYFWAIDCLTEFDKSITDNLIQWEQYRVARIDPILHGLSTLDRRHLSHIERQYAVLQSQRDSFRQKLVAIKALRDALFNASAVIESRASTRLGENVKLLTFVSIFFLPLSFISSLWSINDAFSRSALIYTIILVALATYLAMFNINTLADFFSDSYSFHKRKVVHAMKADRSRTDKWRRRGRRFEVFKPRYDNLQPSEWLVPLYALMHPKVLFGWSWFSGTLARRNSEREASSNDEFTDGTDVQDQSGWLPKLLSLSSWRRRRRHQSRNEVNTKAARTDEGWVL